MAHCVGSSDVRPNIICFRSFSFGADKNKMILFFTRDKKKLSIIHNVITVESSTFKITIISMKK